VATQKVLDEKQKVIDEISDRIKESSSVIFFDYRGLKDKDLAILRKNLKTADSEMKIYKNTLTERALNDLKLSVGDVLDGPSAIAISKDEIAPIKILSDFSKKNSIIAIKGGILNGSVISLEQVNSLSQIPSREGLLTMLAGGLIGVVRDLSIALNLYAEKDENK